MPDPASTSTPAPTPPAGMTADSELKVIVALSDQGESTQHKLGQSYNNFVTYELALLAGYKSTQEFFKQALKNVTGLSQANLTRYGAIARNFTEAETLEYGVSRLELFLVYRNLARLPETVRPADATIDSPSGQKPFAQCSANDLRAATRALRGSKELPEEVSQAVERLQAALVASLGADHPAAAVKGRTKGKEGVVDIDGIPLEHLPDVLEALKKA